MKLAYYNFIGEKKNGEAELWKRFMYAFQIRGIEMLEVNKDGYVINKCADEGKYIEGLDIPFVFGCDVFDHTIPAIPDIPSVFLHFSPIGFSANYTALNLIKQFHSYDYCCCSSEEKVISEVSQVVQPSYQFMGTSVPKDFAKPAKFQKKRKLFYTGINFERHIQSMRYGELLQNLDKTGQLMIYGPKSVYGVPNLWADFQSYQGEIPFDGHTIIERINEAGVCLALNSPMHNDAGAVTSRTYEGAAAGAVLISDDNPFVRQYFGDSVFYIDPKLTEKEASDYILSTLKWINDHPKEAFQKAQKSQEIFLKKLTLDKMVDDFLNATKVAFETIHDKSKQVDLIDVMCFVDDIEGYPAILAQLERQYYQNLHIIIIAPPDVYQKLHIDVEHDYVSEYAEMKGPAFVEAKKYLRGKYFMFVDKYSVMHARHIYKNHQMASIRDELFVYSGVYLKKTYTGGRRYMVLNNKPITTDEFLLFSTASADQTDWYYRDIQCFFIETIFARSCALFSKEILNYADDFELSLISEAIHYYLACCSLVKAQKMGRFTYTLTTGYSGNSVEEINHTVFGHTRRHWYSNSRSAKTYIKELNEIFFKYTFECHPMCLPPRSINGEPGWVDEIAPAPAPDVPMSRKRKLVRKLKKLIPKRLKAFLLKCFYA